MTVAITYIVLCWESINPHIGLIREEISKWCMLKLAFTKKGLQSFLNVIPFTPVQERIIMYRMKKETRVKMAELENISIETIDHKIKKIAKKYENPIIVIW